MQVETFECEETATEPTEASTEALDLIGKLGLEGQQKLLSKSDDAESVRVPYRKMTADERFIYHSLCPLDTALAKYADEPMPLRVLQVAAHATSLNFFDELRVWHRESADVKDPVLVGQKKVGYDVQLYILARWGESLDEWPALLKAGMALWRESTKAAVTEIVSELQTFLRDVDTMPMSSAMKKRDKPSFYW